MRKINIVLVAVTLSLILCSCGGNSGGGTTSKSDSGEKIIEFDNAIVAEDFMVKVELISFYEQTFANVDVPTKNMSFKVTNKSDSDLYFNLNHYAYIGDEQVTTALAGSGTEGPAPGKSGIYNYTVKYDTAPEDTQLEALEDLYTFEGSFDIAKREGNSNVDHYDLEFKLSDISGSTNNAQNAEEKTEGNKAEASANNSDFAYLINGILKEEDGSDVLLNSYDELIAKRDNFKIMSDDEIKKEINGDFYYTSLSRYNNNGIIVTYRRILNFDGTKVTQKLYYKYGISDDNPEEQNTSYDYTVKDGIEKNKERLQVRKISDGYYALYGQESEGGDYTLPKEFMMKVHMDQDSSEYVPDYPIS